MPTGRVKWFSDNKGYGFIEQDKGDDVFVHHSEIQRDGLKTLTKGERVRFEVTTHPKGLCAVNVERISDSTGSLLQ